MDVLVPSRSKKFHYWHGNQILDGNFLHSPYTVHSPLFFRKIVEIEHFALQAAILVSNVTSLAWQWVLNRGLWTVYTALYAPPCMKEREQAPIAVIK